MNFKIIWPFIIIITIIITSSCDRGSLCLSGQNAIQAGLYSPSSENDKDTTLTGIYLWGINNDSVLIDSARVNKLFMPTDLNSDSSAFIIREEKLIGENIIYENDTLLFIYTRDLNYISGDCGFSYNLVLDTVIHTNNLIDSVIISNPSVSYNENLENVKIYIEP